MLQRFPHWLETATALSLLHCRIIERRIGLHLAGVISGRPFGRTRWRGEMLQQRVVGPRDMSEEPSAIAKISPPPGDYDAICAALMQTERGRWFLQEYARRSRGADTALLLAAIARIEAAVCVERHAQVQQDFRSDLLDMAEAITRTRAEVAEPANAASPAPRSPQPGDVFAAAERIRDVTWAMRGHGFDPGTC